MALKITITQSTSNKAFGSTVLPAGLLDRSQVGVAGGLARQDDLAAETSARQALASSLPGTYVAKPVSGDPVGGVPTKQSDGSVTYVVPSGVTDVGY